MFVFGGKEVIVFKVKVEELEKNIVDEKIKYEEKIVVLVQEKVDLEEWQVFFFWLILGVGSF